MRARQVPGTARRGGSAVRIQPGRVTGDPGLGGTGLVADDLYLMAHDENTGRPLLRRRALGTGLAGGLLAELMLAGCITVRHDGAVALGRTWPAGELARQVRDVIAAEHEPHLVREWLLYLARTAARDVALRLEQAGYLTRVRSLVPGRPGRMVPVNPDWAFAPMLRVRSALDSAREFTPHAGVLAGLAVACGLGFRLAQYVPPAGRRLDDVAARLDPGLRELIAQTQAAVDSAVLSHRT